MQSKSGCRGCGSCTQSKQHPDAHCSSLPGHRDDLCPRNALVGPDVDLVFAVQANAEAVDGSADVDRAFAQAQAGCPGSRSETASIVQVSLSGKSHLSLAALGWHLFNNPLSTIHSLLGYKPVVMPYPCNTWQKSVLRHPRRSPPDPLPFSIGAAKRHVLSIPHQAVKLLSHADERLCSRRVESYLRYHQQPLTCRIPHPKGIPAAIDVRLKECLHLFLGQDDENVVQGIDVAKVYCFAIRRDKAVDCLFIEWGNVLLEVRDKALDRLV